MDGRHSRVSSYVLYVTPYVLVLHLNLSNDVIYLLDDIIKCHSDLERLTKELFVDHAVKEKCVQAFLLYCIESIFLIFENKL